MSLNHAMGDVGVWVVGFGVWGTVLDLRELIFGITWGDVGIGCDAFWECGFGIWDLGWNMVGSQVGESSFGAR